MSESSSHNAPARPAFLKRAALGALLLVVAGAALGLLANLVHPGSLGLFQPPPPRAADDSRFVLLERVRGLWEKGQVVFVDARSPEEFGKGHIEGAISIPAEDFETHYAKHAQFLPENVEIIVYCEGWFCELAEQVHELLSKGRRRLVHIYEGGWEEWTEKGLPAAEGGE